MSIAILDTAKSTINNINDCMQHTFKMIGVILKLIMLLHSCGHVNLVQLCPTHSLKSLSCHESFVSFANNNSQLADYESSMCSSCMCCCFKLDRKEGIMRKPTRFDFYLGKMMMAGDFRDASHMKASVEYKSPPAKFSTRLFGGYYV